MPMLLEGRQLIFAATIDVVHRCPLSWTPADMTILTAQAAQSLGLRGEGAGASGGSGSGTISTQYTHVRSVRIGNAELRDQTFLVIPYPYSFYERGKKAPLAGILGLEFFEHFTVRLDYGDHTVTFTLPAVYISRRKRFTSAAYVRRPGGYAGHSGRGRRALGSLRDRHWECGDIDPLRRLPKTHRASGKAIPVVKRLLVLAQEEAIAGGRRRCDSLPSRDTRSTTSRAISLKMTSGSFSSSTKKPAIRVQRPLKIYSQHSTTHIRFYSWIRRDERPPLE